MKITADDLRKIDACGDQVALFEETFPDGFNPTLANIRRALKSGLDVEWHAVEYFTATARKEFEEAIATALREGYKRMAREVIG